MGIGEQVIPPPATRRPIVARSSPDLGAGDYSRLAGEEEPVRGGRARDEKKFLFLRCCRFHIQETNLNGFVKKNSTAISYESSPLRLLSRPRYVIIALSPSPPFPRSRAFRLVFANECVSSIISSISSRQSSRPYLFVSSIPFYPSLSSHSHHCHCQSFRLLAFSSLTLSPLRASMLTLRIGEIELDKTARHPHPRPSPRYPLR